jgi:hypothetical protein
MDQSKGIDCPSGNLIFAGVPIGDDRNPPLTEFGISYQCLCCFGRGSRLDAVSHTQSPARSSFRQYSRQGGFAISPDGNRNPPTLMQGPYEAMPGICKYGGGVGVQRLSALRRSGHNLADATLF